MALLRFLLPALAAVLLSACGASSMNQSGGDTQHLGTISSATAAQAPQDAVLPKDAAPRDQDTAMRKVALSLSSVSDPNSKAYKIGPLDVLEVSVFKVPDLSKTVQVSEAGTISYPLLGDVEAGGKTAREVEQELTRSLGARYLQKPQITVFVKEHNSQRITIQGAVKKPGVYPIAGGMSLLQATAVAGGFEANADETVLLLRQSNGGRRAAKYDVARISQGRAEDPELEAGDVIIAPTSDLKDAGNTLLKILPLATIVPLL